MITYQYRKLGRGIKSLWIQWLFISLIAFVSAESAYSYYCPLHGDNKCDCQTRTRTRTKEITTGMATTFISMSEQADFDTPNPYYTSPFFSLSLPLSFFLSFFLSLLLSFFLPSIIKRRYSWRFQLVFSYRKRPTVRIKFYTQLFKPVTRIRCRFSIHEHWHPASRSIVIKSYTPTSPPD